MTKTTENNARFQKAQRLSMELSSCTDEDKRMFLLKEIGVRLGKYSTVRPPIHIDYGNTKIGENCFINGNCTFVDYGGITLGNNVGISFGCTLIAHDHLGNPLLQKEWVDIPTPIVIEDDVWIGANVTILGNVTIGKGSIVGAGSVVTKDIPAGEVWTGNPARFLETVEEYGQRNGLAKGRKLLTTTKKCVTVKGLREKTGLSQKDFAIKYKLSLKQLQSWEQGWRNTPESTLYMLERLVDLDFGKERHSGNK